MIVIGLIKYGNKIKQVKNTASKYCTDAEKKRQGEIKIENSFYKRKIILSAVFGNQPDIGIAHSNIQNVNTQSNGAYQHPQAVLFNSQLLYKHRSSHYHQNRIQGQLKKSPYGVFNKLFFWEWHVCEIKLFWDGLNKILAALSK